MRQAGQDLRLQIYPGADGSFVMYDGSRFEWQQTQRRLLVSGIPSPRWIAVRSMADGAQPERIEGSDGRPIEPVPGSWVRTLHNPAGEVVHSMLDPGWEHHVVLVYGDAVPALRAVSRFTGLPLTVL